MIRYALIRILRIISLCAVLAGPARAGLIINPTLDPAVTPAQAKAIGAAILVFETAFKYTYDNNASIYFKAAPLPVGVIGESISATYDFHYPFFKDALSAASASTRNPVVRQAVNGLAGNGAGTPGDTIVRTTSADARMLIADDADLDLLCGACSGTLDKNGNAGGFYDGVISFTVAPVLAGAALDYDRSDGIWLAPFDAQRVIEHEIAEVLGIGGGGSILPDKTDPAGTIGAMDLFRYDRPSHGSLSTDPLAASYFSLDAGITPILSFNQGHTGCLTNMPENCGDFGDWANTVTNSWTDSCGAGHVQDAFACAYQIADVRLKSPEGIALQAIGYDPVPEPLTLALLAPVFLVLAWSRRRRAPAPGGDHADALKPAVSSWRSLRRRPLPR